MVYAVSDLHGRYDKLVELFDKINFNDNDKLYLLGDLVDRGKGSTQLLLEIMKRKNNVFCCLGNHELMLLNSLPNKFKFLTEHGYKATLDLDIWYACGGDETCRSLSECDDNTILQIYRYIQSLPLYQTVSVGDKNFLLVHAGLGNYNVHKPLEAYSAKELVWKRFDIEGTYYPKQFDNIIVGHTPTLFLTYHRPPRIFKGGGNVVDIDTGAIFEEGRLACLNLDTMEEYYV